MDLKGKWEKLCDGCLVWFIVGFMILTLLGGIYGAVMLIVHKNDKENVKQYDEYLEEQYDGMERYDPV